MFIDTCFNSLLYCLTLYSFLLYFFFLHSSILTPSIYNYLCVIISSSLFVQFYVSRPVSIDCKITINQSNCLISSPVNFFISLYLFFIFFYFTAFILHFLLIYLLWFSLLYFIFYISVNFNFNQPLFSSHISNLRILNVRQYMFPLDTFTI